MKIEKESGPPNAAVSSSLTPRGEKRRGALLDAALRIVVREGPGAVTLRSVVSEAGASHGSVAYYFGSREELVREVLIRVAAKNTQALAHAWEDIASQPSDPQVLASLIARHSMKQMVEDRSMGITILELHLAAARYNELRPSLRRWGRAYAKITFKTLAKLGSGDPKTDSAMLINIINGHLMGQLALPRKDFEQNILVPVIERFLSNIAGRER